MASCWTLYKHHECSHILHTLTSTKLFPTSTSNSQLIWTIFSSTCMSSWSATTLAQEPKGTPKKENIVWWYLLLEFFEIIPTPFAHVDAFHMSQYHVAVQVTTIKMASYWTLPFQASSLLPHSPCMSTKLLPTKTSNSQPLEWTIHEPACFLQSLPQLAHALNHLNKVNLSTLIPSHHICWKSYITFLGCLVFTYFAIF